METYEQAAAMHAMVTIGLPTDFKAFWAVAISSTARTSSQLRLSIRAPPDPLRQYLAKERRATTDLSGSWSPFMGLKNRRRAVVLTDSVQHSTVLVYTCDREELLAVIIIRCMLLI